MRLARFFRDEAADLRARGGDGRPPRVLDLGCGRGGYVEALNRFGVVAVGVDGDAVIGRSLPGTGILWDATVPFDLEGEHAAALGALCSLEEARGEGQGDLRLLTSLAVAGLGEADAEELLRHLCCGDLRCAAFGIIEEMSLGTLWRLPAAGDAEGIRKGTNGVSTNRVTPLQLLQRRPLC